jgi:TonB family protein
LLSTWLSAFLVPWSFAQNEATVRPIEEARATVPAIAKRIPNPEYTKEARAAKIQGVVMVKTHINAEGIPTEVSAEKSVGYGLEEKAEECVRRWRFTPAHTKELTNVAYDEVIRVPFRLANPENLTLIVPEQENITLREARDGVTTIRERMVSEPPSAKMRGIIAGRCRAPLTHAYVNDNTIVCASESELEVYGTTEHFQVLLGFELIPVENRTRLTASSRFCRFESGRCTPLLNANSSDLDKMLEEIEQILIPKR